ncbi:MAG: AAA family ATPase [Cycloclasticus sp.]
MKPGNKKQLWLLAGGNGSGKSTFYRTRLEPLGMAFINADILAKQLFQDEAVERSYEAAKIAESMRLDLLNEGRTFCFETVFSHPSKIDFVAKAKTLGYEIVLVYIHLETAALNQARVSQRVSEGGHQVPDEKVISRIPRVMENIKQVFPLCDYSYILDNSRLDNPFQQIAAIKNGQTNCNKKHLPLWAATLLSNYLEN